MPCGLTHRSVWMLQDVGRICLKSFFFWSVCYKFPAHALRAKDTTKQLTLPKTCCENFVSSNRCRVIPNYQWSKVGMCKKLLKALCFRPHFCFSTIVIFVWKAPERMLSACWQIWAPFGTQGNILTKWTGLQINWLGGHVSKTPSGFKWQFETESWICLFGSVLHSAVVYDHTAVRNGNWCFRRSSLHIAQKPRASLQ